MAALPPEGGGSAGRVPGLPAAGRAAAAARQAAAEHLRAALPGDDRGCARPRPHVRHDPAGPQCGGGRNRARPVSHRLPRPAVVVQRDRRGPVSDHAVWPGPLLRRRGDRDAPWLPAGARRFLRLSRADLDSGASAYWRRARCAAEGAAQLLHPSRVRTPTGTRSSGCRTICWS